jgi:hypothetical protein
MFRQEKQGVKTLTEAADFSLSNPGTGGPNIS